MSTMIRFLLCVTLLISLTACDPAYPIFLRNGLSAPITMLTKFEGSTSNEGVLLPGESLAFLHPKGEIERVVVFFEGRMLHDLNRSALLDMQNSVDDPRQVTWNIQSDGIKPLSRVDLERIEKH